MIVTKLVIWDLDGVLIDSRRIHFLALNRALDECRPSMPIMWDEHLSKYDGLPTTKKLQLLTKEKGLPASEHDTIWSNKQKHTVELYQEIGKNLLLQSMFGTLRARGIKIAVASNSIYATMAMALSRLGIIEYVDYMVSNEEVKHTKPFPEMFWRCMIQLKALPENTVIIEDSHIGREAALASKAHLIPVRDTGDVHMHLVDEILDYFEKGPQKKSIPWRNPKMNVLIPMAGAGSRFVQAGFTNPKPLIEVNGKPMIQIVQRNLNIDAHYIFLVQKEHYSKYQLQLVLNLISPGCDIVQVDGITEGAACTALLSKHLIDNENPLFIANSDQVVEWNSNEVLYSFTADTIDGGIVTFNSVHPKWSYCRLDEHGFVAEVAEKRPISDIATCGLYYWTRGSDFVTYAERMVAANERTNGEFYIAPAFNQAIADGKKVRVKNIEKMWGIGTPEDLEYFLNHYDKLKDI